MIHLLGAAEHRIKEFYGSARYRPRVLVCATSQCIRRFGGNNGSTGSIGSLVLLLSSQSINIIDISHQLALIELQGRMGMFHMFMGSVPAWFEEGVAVLVSDDPQFIATPPNKRDRCLADPNNDLPVQMSNWRRKADSDPSLYASAACRVDRWMLARGGSMAVVRLLDRIAHGGSFKHAYAEH